MCIFSELLIPIEHLGIISKDWLFSLHHSNKEYNSIFLRINIHDNSKEVTWVRDAASYGYAMAWLINNIINVMFFVK